MAEITLKDVIERLKAEGQLVRNTGNNSIKSMKKEINVSLKNQTDVLQNILKAMLKGQEIEKREKELGRAQRDQVIGSETGRNETIEKEKEETDNILLLAFRSLKGMGLALTALAAGIGVSIGIVAGQFSAISTFFPKTATSIIKSFTAFTARFTTSINNFINFFRTSISNINGTIVKVFADFGRWVGGLLSTTTSGVNRLGSIGRLITSSVSAISGGIQSIASTFVNIASGIGNAVKASANITGRFSGIINTLKSFGNAVANVARAVGRVFAPIAIIITLFDTVRGTIDGFAEDGVLGAFRGAINGFFTSLITKPLDLIKDMVAWVVGKLGFDETAEAIRSFSFTTLFTDMTGAIFDNIKSVIEWVKTIFTDPVAAISQLWNSIVGEGGLIDILYMPVNKAIDWITKKFGWRDEDAPEFSIQDIINDWVDSVKAWVIDIFSFLPSSSDVKEALLAALPARLRRFFTSDEVSEEDAERNLIQREIDDLRSARSDAMITAGQFGQVADTSSMDEQIRRLEEDLLSFRGGTKGFMDFGLGTPAMLHGIEAVVPINTPAGKFLAQNFDNNFQPIMNKIAGMESAALHGNSAPIVIANAPTIAPVNNNISGPTNVSSQRYTAIGENSGSGMGRFAN